MADFLSAHGYAPGPTQRPLLAGAVSGLIATIPAIGLLQLFGTLPVEAAILRLSIFETLAAGSAGAVMVLPIASGGLAPAGDAALGAFLSLVVWGGALGTLLPFVQRRLHQDLETAAKRDGTGPDAAAG
jgi:hypothetical protein